MNRYSNAWSQYPTECCGILYDIVRVDDTQAKKLSTEFPRRLGVPKCMTQRKWESSESYGKCRQRAKPPANVVPAQPTLSSLIIGAT